MSHKLWRHAASIILGAPIEHHLTVLMTQRSSSIRFMPSSYVFPGGEVSVHDFDPFWQRQYDQLDLKTRQMYPLRSETNRAATYSRYDNSGNETRAECAFRVCALRELFEECGILVVHDKDTQTYSVLDLDSNHPLLTQQQRVHDSADLFSSLFAESNLVPAFWTLREWSNWLTPSFTPDHLRFDTMFFVLCLPETAKFNLCSRENDNAQWINPEVIVQHGRDGQISLPPPQFYELSRLRHFHSTTELENFSANREKYGVVRFCPQIAKLSQSHRIGVLPGDDLYDSNEVPEDRKLFEVDENTVESCENKHRALWTVKVAGNKSTVWKNMRYETQNVQPLCGHSNPL